MSHWNKGKADIIILENNNNKNKLVFQNIKYI